MNDENSRLDNEDSKADAIAATAILLIVIAAVVYWLSRF
tara:strand:- start:652 stop:768 length:117 start_codon:yes stop_codon:yes gene_type:complete